MNNLISLFNERIAALDTSSIIQLAAIFVILTVFYRFIYFRRSFSIAAGVVIMYGVYIASKIFNLAYIFKVLDKFVEYGPILLMLIFANELRAVFENFGNLFMILRTKPTDKKIAQELVEAIKTLTLTHIGASLIIERKTKLEHLTNMAVMLDAYISTNFILNIFSGEGPMHDGAVLIRNGRIYAAACKIHDPNVTNLPPHYGLRHQSALNLSAASDAFIIIVSEEASTVSYAENGQLKHFKDEAEMIEMIYSAMNVKGHTKKKKQKIAINLSGTTANDKKSK